MKTNQKAELRLAFFFFLRLKKPLGYLKWTECIAFFDPVAGSPEEDILERFHHFDRMVALVDHDAVGLGCVGGVGDF